MKHFICYIKSHCEAPDFVYEGEAKSKQEFVRMLLKGNGGLGQMGWEYPEVERHVAELDTECPNCGTLDNQHKCADCGDEITEKECEESGGLCYRCSWLMGK